MNGLANISNARVRTALLVVPSASRSANSRAVGICGIGKSYNHEIDTVLCASDSIMCMVSNNDVVACAYTYILHTVFKNLSSFCTIVMELSIFNTILTT